MRFKSIQFSVVVLAGASVLAVVVALVLYALFAGSRTQDLVHERTQGLLEQVIDQRLIALAEAQVGKLQRHLGFGEDDTFNPQGLEQFSMLGGNPFDDDMPCPQFLRMQGSQ